jgi:sugar lactone lactonase YvrE
MPSDQFNGVWVTVNAPSALRTDAGKAEFDGTLHCQPPGLPHSLDMHLTERWALGSDGNSPTAAFTIADAANYAAPWTTSLHFKRAPKGTGIQEDLCLERLKLVNKWERTTGWAQVPEGRALAAMSNIGVDSRGHVWVADRCGPQMCTDSPLAPILEFDANGKYLQSFGAGLFVAPHGIHIDRAGNIWVTDFRTAGGKGSQALKFRRDSKLLLSLGQKGTAGAAPGQFNVVADVATTRDGTIYVADGHGAGTNERIVMYRKDGKYLGTWGKAGAAPGEFNGIHAIAIDQRDRVLVGERGGARVQVFDKQGQLLAEWKQFGAISGLAIGAQDRLYVSGTDPTNVALQCIWVADAHSGNILAHIPGTPNADGMGTTAPEDIAVDRAGNIYGPDIVTHNIVRYAPH